MAAGGGRSAVELIARGHAVRGTTRDRPVRGDRGRSARSRCVGDPDRVATLAPALEQVTVVCVLLGSAVASPEQLAALHGTRLQMLLSRIVDTTVRAIVYEAAGSVDPDVLAAGAALVRDRCEDSRIPYSVLDADPGEPAAWTVAALAAVQLALDGGTAGPQ